MSAAQNATNLKSFNRFQGLINQMRGVTLLILEPDDKGQWRFVHCSPDFTEASGIAKERLLGCTLDDLFPDIITDEAELTKMREALQFCLLQKLHFSITQHLIFNPSKVETWWRSTLNPVLDESGNPVMILYCAVEITEQKQSELLLQQSEYKFRSVINDQTEMIVRWLPGGIRTFVNKAYCDEFKIEPKEALGSSFFDLIEPSDRQLVEHRISKLSPENPVSTAMHEVVLLNGEKGWQLLGHYGKIGRDRVQDS
jgi:PAS domain S-box-containing protein